MNVRELRQFLSTCDPWAVVTISDPHLHVDCHIQIEKSEWSVLIESTGRIVTEEDVE